MRWFPKKVPIIYADFTSTDNNKYGMLSLDKTFIESGEKFLQPNAESILIKSKTLSTSIPLEFDYGYAITCHKAQGSEWQKVLVFEEKFPYNKIDHLKHLYTSVTRASEKLVLVKAEKI